MNKQYRLLIAMMALFAQPLYAQTCRNDITSTTPTQDFTLHDDGTVTHHKTGLMWMRCALGQNWDGVTCAGKDIGYSQAYNWASALQAAYSLSFAGHSDWRLPNIKELNSIVEQACISPAINTTVFPATPLLLFRYWSASPSSAHVDGAWGASFDYGHNTTGARTDVGHVRLVRGGQ